MLRGGDRKISPRAMTAKPVKRRVVMSPRGCCGVALLLAWHWGGAQTIVDVGRHLTNPGQGRKCGMHKLRRTPIVGSARFRACQRGKGVHTFEAGSCWIQPSHIRHAVRGYSDDCELLEIVLPADFKTVTLEKL